MPKIIQNARMQLLQEAKKQISENGYAKTTIRSIAGKCGLAVGTVYNYFSSKDMLIASFLAEDWQACMGSISAYPSENKKSLLYCIYKTLCDFSSRHQVLFSDVDAAKVYAAVFTERHKQLRDQLAECILPLCQEETVEQQEFLSQFIAESLLTWTMAGTSFEEIYQVLQKLL